MAMTSNITENTLTVYQHEINVKDITYNKYCEIYLWVFEHGFVCRSDYDDLGDTMNTWWQFKCKDAATLFKLTWG